MGRVMALTFVRAGADAARSSRHLSGVEKNRAGDPGRGKARAYRSNGGIGTLETAVSIAGPNPRHSTFPPLRTDATGESEAIKGLPYGTSPELGTKQDYSESKEGGKT